MSITQDCRHSVRRQGRGPEVTERCKLDANQPLPFTCPESCIFSKPRGITTVGWLVSD